MGKLFKVLGSNAFHVVWCGLPDAGPLSNVSVPFLDCIEDKVTYGAVEWLPMFSPDVTLEAVRAGKGPPRAFGMSLSRADKERTR